MLLSKQMERPRTGQRLKMDTTVPSRSGINCCSSFSFIPNLHPRLHPQLLYTLSCTAAFFSSGVFSVEGGGSAAGASTSGTFSFTGEELRFSAALDPAGGSSAETGGGLPPKLRAISSKVLPFVSGTLRKVKMKKMTRKAAKMMNTQGPHSS